MWSFPRSGDHFNTDKRHFSFFRRSTRKLYLLVSKHGCTNIHATVQIVRPSFPPYSFPSYTHFTSTKCDIARDRVEFLFWDLIFQHFRSNPDFRSWPVIFPLFFLREREREREREGGREEIVIVTNLKPAPSFWPLQDLEVMNGRNIVENALTNFTRAYM